MPLPYQSSLSSSISKDPRPLNPEASYTLSIPQAMRTAIKEATASMTSVPKPLKFLRGHYGELKTTFDGIAAGANSQSLADILSVLAMTAGAEGGRRACATGSGAAARLWAAGATSMSGDYTVGHTAIALVATVGLILMERHQSLSYPGHSIVVATWF